MRGGIGIVLVLLLIVAMYVVLGTFFRDTSRRDASTADEGDPPPTAVKVIAGADSIGPRPAAVRAWYRYETRSPVRFWGSWAFMLLWGAFLTAAAERFVAAIVEAVIGALVLVYAFIRWQRGNRWTPAASPPPPAPLPLAAPPPSDKPDAFVIVDRESGGTSRDRE